jgi:hypothetical protein
LRWLLLAGVDEDENGVRVLGWLLLMRKSDENGVALVDEEER